MFEDRRKDNDDGDCTISVKSLPKRNLNGASPKFDSNNFPVSFNFPVKSILT